MREQREQMLKKGVTGRLLKSLFGFYPVLLPLTILCIIVSAAISSVPAVFMQKVISIVEDSWQSGDWNAVSEKVVSSVGLLALFYVLSLAANVTYNQLMAVITQGTLKKLRCEMFKEMQKLPVKYFDTHNHGDVMSYYTNDIDTLRQLISQSLPQLLISAVTVITIFVIMLYYCIWLTLVILVGVAAMLLITKHVGGRSARYFFRQQVAIGKTEGFVEEMMNGQKVIKVFNHEEECKCDFDRINDMLRDESTTANKYANILGPILNNTGNILCVAVALIGGACMIGGVFNISLSGLPLGVSIVVPFLNMTKQFTGNVNQVSHQINSVVAGVAGAGRIFDLIDEAPETDEGCVSLVNIKEENGAVCECEERTDRWAWKQRGENGEFAYTELKGAIEIDHIDFAYEEGKTILHGVSIDTKPGQKIALVGATGAGKTTITNLLNRFYDIESGEIRYDGIELKEIRKRDLRRSIGVVLQDTNLFTGTVMENIRYGNLDASDEACISAAKLAGADDFITRLPEGYDTVLQGNGANLSQGQRQLLSIARAAVADPPVMILDEATSSIDTRTEAIVQRGMNNLMKGRTVFVIAHRLSTVKNSDRIIVLAHGKIIEQGRHEELLAQKGQYYQLYTGAFELE